MSYVAVSKALQQAYYDGNESANGNRPGSLWDWTKPLGLTMIGPSSIEPQPLNGVIGPGRATLSELEVDPNLPDLPAPPQERYEASMQNGWYSKLKEATPEKNKYYEAEVITNDRKKIIGTVHWTYNFSRIWKPNRFSDFALK